MKIVVVVSGDVVDFMAMMTAERMVRGHYNSAHAVTSVTFGTIVRCLNGLIVTRVIKA